jgi:hypothetical protein
VPCDEPSAVHSRSASSHRVEHAVDERHGLFAAEGARQLERLVDDTFAGVAASVSISEIASRMISRSMTAMRSMRQFFSAPRSARRAPARADRAGDQRVRQRPRCLVDDASRHGVGVLVSATAARRGPASRCGPPRAPTTRPTSAWIQHLQRGFARPVPRRPSTRSYRNPNGRFEGARQRLVEEPPSRSRPAALPGPCCSGPGPDRAVACSIVSVVKTAEGHRNAGVAGGVGDAVRHREAM